MSIKTSIKNILLRTGVLRLRQVLRPGTTVILAYHSVSRDRQGQAFCVNPGITTDAERFRDQMKLLRRNYRPVSLDDIADYLSDKRELPRRSVAVTFDDGFADNAEVAAPIMEEFGIFGTFYLTVDSVARNELPWFCRMEYLFRRAEREKKVLRTSDGDEWKMNDPTEYRAAYLKLAYPCARLSGDEQRQHVESVEELFGDRLDPTASPRMMTFDQARDLRRRGHIVGSHSFSHGNMAHLSSEDLRREITEADAILSKELGEKVGHFSYPHPCLQPQWNEASFALTRELGYRTAVLTQSGSVTKITPPLLLPRLCLSDPDLNAFHWKLETALVGIET